MNLSKADPRTQMEMDMTPMIDVVFLLIIFFMIITDMTQKELEDLQLPTAENAQPDKPNSEEFRPIINIKIDGTIWVKRILYYDPEHDDDYEKMRGWLSDVAKRMKKTDKYGPTLPDEPLLIRADMNTPFKHIQKVMEQCGLSDIQIWKIQLAAAETEKEEE
jgi:biopolymer transport protein ExbD